MKKQNTVIISNGNMGEFNELLDIFIEESFIYQQQKSVFIETISENYRTFTKSVTFTTDFTKQELLSSDSLMNLADTFIFNGKKVNLAQ